MKTYEIYIGGQFKKTDYQLTVTNPYNNEIVAKTFLAKKEELEEAILAAQSIQNEMKGMPSFQKFEILMQISNEIKNNRAHLANVLAQEAAKPLRYARGEIDRAAQTFLVAAEESKRLPSDYISIDWTPAGKGKEGLVKYFPLGLIAGISPFNFIL